MAAKPRSIKGTGGKCGGCALKAVALIRGGLPHVRESVLRVERFTVAVWREPAAGIVDAQAAKVHGAGSGA